jgi:exopolysaccharide production protein ExoZ
MVVFRSIQYLRAFAALSVLLFHVTQRGHHSVTVGAGGVDVFFVISGFIMATITNARVTTPFEFLRDRLVRIAPCYWIVTLLLVTLAAVIPQSFSTFTAPAHHLLLSLAFIPHTDPLGQNFPVLVPGWTLNYEMFFYVLMALALLLPQRWRLPSVTAVLLCLVGIGAAVPSTNLIFLSYTNPLLLEFASGMLLATGWLGRALPGRGWGWIAVTLGLSAFLLQAVWPDGSHLASSGAGRLAVWGLPAFCLVAGALAVETHGGIGSSRLGLELGGASYALYLLHGLIVSLCWKLLGGAPLPVLTITAMLSSVLIAIAFYRMVELPISSKLRGWIRAARTTTSGSMRTAG